jgi:MYXO-CTERM domain-containing protein
MPAKVRKKRKDPGRLTNPLERRIKDYSLAAVGIGAVAFAPSASAAVVTTGVINYNVPVNTTYTVNIGGNNAIIISNSQSTSTTTNGVFATQGTVNAKVFALPGKGRDKDDVLPLNAGQNVSGALSTFGKAVVLASTTDKNNWTGFLGNAKYLGFSFGTGANIHYGWVEINITQSKTNGPYTVTVVEAAYETVAGKALPAGATSDSPSPTPAPNTLWLTALGAAGLAGLEAMRRRRRA